MPINFTCKCGKALEVDTFLAGRDVRCPACSATVRAPERSQDSSARLEETPVEHIKARIYEGLDRDQLSTKVLVVAGGWFALFLAISFFTSWSMQYSSFFMWLFIWIPLIALLEIAAYLALTANRWGRPLLVAGSLVGLGVSWTYIFLAILSFEGDFPTPKSAGITFMSSFVNILVSLGILWYFGRHYLAGIVTPTDDVSQAPDSVKDISPK